MFSKTAPQRFLLTLLFLQAVVAFSEETKISSTKDEIPTDPLGEWYEVGYKMAVETAPSFRMFSVSEADLSLRLNRVLETLGADVHGIKLAELKLLQQGWDDAAIGKKQAMTYPSDQRGSLVPKELRGFHRFNDSSSNDLADRAAEWKKAVAMVRIKDEGHGTGFFIGPGLLVTNHHVIERATETNLEVQLESDQSIHKGVVVASEEVPDIALVKIAFTNHAILTLGNSVRCKALDKVVLIGYPASDKLRATIVDGSISATDRTYHDLKVLQVSIPSYGGNSGGPLISMEGTVVGIHTAAEKDPKLSQFKYAQEIDFVMPFIEKHAAGQYKQTK